MTPTQIDLVALLLAGGNIVRCPNGVSRLRNAANEPVRKVNSRTLQALKYLLRKQHNGLFVIDKRKVRQLNGNCTVKKLYKKLCNEKETSNSCL